MIPKDAKKRSSLGIHRLATTAEMEVKLAYSQPGSRYSSLKTQILLPYVEYEGMLTSLPIAKGRPRIAAYSGSLMH